MSRLPSLLLALWGAGCAGPSDDDAAGDTDTDVVADVLPPCPVFAEPVSAGLLASDALVEVSGIAASRASPGVWWMHNDSGAGPKVYATGADGAELGVFEVPGALALDWEDMAIAPDGEGWALLVGDIGDNLAIRGDITLWRFPEPDPTSAGMTATPDEIHLEYPDGPHNAETLMVDPRTGDAYVVSKVSDALTEVSRVFRAAAPLTDGATMEEVATLAFSGPALPGDALTTGGEISPDGDRIAIRTYTAAFVWRRTPHQTVGEALAGDPCPVPLAGEPQGEAIGWDPATGGYRTVSEFAHPELWTYVPK